MQGGAASVNPVSGQLAAAEVQAQAHVVPAGASVMEHSCSRGDGMLVHSRGRQGNGWLSLAARSSYASDNHC